MTRVHDSESRPDVSVVIPVYNRGEKIRWTLESVQRASVGLRVQTIIIDDGSEAPLDPALVRYAPPGAELHRQPNQGLLFARLAGFARARGEFTLFLDSDDLLHPQKLHLQLAALNANDAGIAYSDEAAVCLDDHWGDADPQNVAHLPALTDVVELLIRAQPAPHNPLFRTDYLRPLIENTWMPPFAAANNVAEIWFYYLCAAAGPVKIIKTDGPLALQGLHPGPRISNQWEKLALGSLAVLEAFALHCPQNTISSPARVAVAERAFLAWRALPRGTPRDYQNRLLAVIDALPAPPLSRLGGRGFGLLARLLGRHAAARLLRRHQRPAYEAIRTLAPGEFARLASKNIQQ